MSLMQNTRTFKSTTSNVRDTKREIINNDRRGTPTFLHLQTCHQLLYVPGVFYQAYHISYLQNASESYSLCLFLVSVDIFSALTTPATKTPHPDNRCLQ